MRLAQAKVREFHDTFELNASDTPGNMTVDVAMRRYKLIQEELQEYAEAVGQQDIVKVADAVADLLYVVLGTAIEHGIDIDPIFDAVHAANMRKAGGRKNEFGKWIKPEGWAGPEPEIKAILEGQNAKS